MSEKLELVEETPIPTTEDGIPLYANGQKLSQTAIQALREARERERAKPAPTPMPKEINGPKSGIEPTRYGDWERKGRCVDF